MQEHKMIVGLLLDYSRESQPAEFRAMFCGLIANVVGNLPDDYWREFLRVEICSEPGCDCHKIQEPVLAALAALRADHKAEMATRKG